MKNVIKTLAVALCAALTFGLTGCSKDAEDLIIGKWDLLEAISTTTVSGTGTEYDGTMTDTTTFKEGEASFTFNEDNTVVIYSVDEETGEPSTETGTYTLNDKKLILSSNGRSNEMTIIEISKKEMTLNTTMSMSEDGASMTMSVDMRFKKAK